MKDVIMQLIKDYFGSDILIRDIVITERRGRQTINIFPNLAANKWMIFVEGTTSSVTGLGKPDIDRTDKILEQRRTMKAQQVFAITQRILRQRQVEKEWNNVYASIIPKIDDHHTKLIDYSIGALFYTKVLVETEYEEMQSIVDEHGILMGQKLLPKQPYDEIQDLFEKQEETKEVKQ